MLLNDVKLYNLGSKEPYFNSIHVQATYVMGVAK